MDDRELAERLTNIENAINEANQRLWLVLENIRPDVIVKAKKEIEKNDKKNKGTQSED